MYAMSEREMNREFESRRDEEHCDCHFDNEYCYFNPNAPRPTQEQLDAIVVPFQYLSNTPNVPVMTLN